MVTCLDKMLSENGQIATELPKQKKFAMVLEKIVWISFQFFFIPSI